MKFLNKFENIAGLASLGLSVCALIVSVRSCSYSERALSLSGDDFAAARTVVLNGKADPANFTMRLECLDQQMSLQRATVWFPRQLRLGSSSVHQPDFLLDLITLRFMMSEALDDRMASLGKTEGFFSSEGSVPIIVESYYVAKGQSRVDRSRYEIPYRYFRFGEKRKLTFNGLYYIRPIDRGAKVGDVLDESWQSVLSNMKFYPGEMDERTKNALFEDIAPSGQDEPPKFQ